MRIAIVGTGIAGMTCAYLLSRRHDVHVYEAQDRIGGHTCTVPCESPQGTMAVDTGFIVFNDRTYPNFNRLLAKLGVASQDSTMSFSVRCERTGLEYNGATLNTLFAQRRNLLSPGFYRMLRDILRFNAQAPAAAEASPRQTLGEYLVAGGYSRRFIEHYVVPMAAAIWSAPQTIIHGFPLGFFVRFFKNHGMLSVNDRPQWKTVRGGSCVYTHPLTAPYRDRIRLGTPVRGIRRVGDGVQVMSDNGTETFDHVVMASHSDEALAALCDPTPAERDVLGAILYQRNVAVLHTDCRLMPRRPLAWAAWNYHIPESAGAPVAVTYNLTTLQRLPTRSQFMVTLNRDERIDPEKVLRRIIYHHPVFTPGAVEAQSRWKEISGVNRTHYCGAYWGNGFHEDGVHSALAVAAAFGEAL